MTPSNKKARLEKDAEQAQPKVKEVYMVSWSLNVSIDGFGDSAFDDCRGDEREETEDMYREIEKSESGTSARACRTIEKANVAALAMFDQLKTQIADNDEDIDEDNDEDNDEDLEKERHLEMERQDIHVSYEKDGRKRWSWRFFSEDEYENSILHDGSVYSKIIHVDGETNILHEGSVYTKLIPVD